MSETPPHAPERAGFTLDHVALGVQRVAAATPFLMGVLGGRPFESGPGSGFRWGQWTFANGGRIELIEPAGPPGGFLHRFLEQRGAGVHHVTFKVPDLARAAARARRLGFPVVGYDASNPGWKEAFLHPKQAQGIVVQLAESLPGVGEGVSPSWIFDAAPDSAPPPVRVCALQLVAQDAGAARRQWGELLGGTCTEREAGLLFRWPGSAIAVRVQPDAGQPEGPRAIEIACERAVDLPAEPHPVLGARFVRLGAAGA